MIRDGQGFLTIVAEKEDYIHLRAIFTHQISKKEAG
jgi:hypothetical protein